METPGNVGYKNDFDPELFKVLQKLPKEIRLAILKKIREAKENPFHFYSRLVGRTEFKLRVGDYRVLVNIDVGQRVIQILQICHRRNIYKT